MLSSTGKPGGAGGIGAGGSGAANVKFIQSKATINTILLFGTILIGRKSKKKISLTKFFILYFNYCNKQLTIYLQISVFFGINVKKTALVCPI